MRKDITTAVQLLDKESKNNKAYENIANSNVILQRNQELTERSKGAKVSSGVINATGNDVITKSLLITDTGRKQVLTAIEALTAKYPGYTDALHDIRTKSAKVLVSDNSSDYPFRNIPDKQGMPAPTYVATDPVKPEEQVTITSDNSQQKPKFNVKELYPNTSNINLYENKYIDINTGHSINENNTIYYSDEGIVEQTSVSNEEGLATYRFVPSDQMKQNTTIDTGSYTSITPYHFEDKVTGQEMLHERSVSKDVVTFNKVKYKYPYMLDGVILEQREIVNVAGYISKPIKVTADSYLELAVDTVNNVEYYIIDGKDEISILPKTVNEIVDEKLFFGLPPRFTIMNPNDIIVKRNGIPIGITTLHELELFLTADTSADSTRESSYKNKYVYTITYKPAENARRYFPRSDNIKVKVIQRVPLGQVPQTIGTVKLLQYNSSKVWHLSSHEEDKDLDYSDPKLRMMNAWNT